MVGFDLQIFIFVNLHILRTFNIDTRRYWLRLKGIFMGKYATDSLNAMSLEINGYVDDLEKGLSIVTGINKDYKRILLAGMGASAIGGAVYRDSMYYQSSVIVTVAKTMALPEWVNDEDTLFVACSYSGNTFETLELYNKAMAAGLDTVVVTYGGELERLALENGNVLIKIGGAKIQPRSAIGWFIGIIGGIIEDAGGPGVRYQLRRMLPWLRSSMEKMERTDSYTHSIANEITKEIYDGVTRIPVVYGTPDMDAVAVRLKNQLNENSKLIAYSGVMPEFNHNEIVGWYEDSHRKLFLPIILRDYMDKDICKLVDSTVEVMRKKGLSPIVVDIKGDSLLERMVYSIMFGDHLSFYVAVNREVDPLNVDPITDIKRTIKSKLER